MNRDDKLTNIVMKHKKLEHKKFEQQGLYRIKEMNEHFT